MAVNSQLKKRLFPLYHGTDIRIVKMTKEERSSLKDDCIKVADYLWDIYKESYNKIINGEYKSVLGEMGWFNLCNALTVCDAYHNGCEKFQYDTFHLAKLRAKAENYAIRSFAFGEVGLMAYRMYDAARILDFPIHTYNDEIQCAAHRIAQFAEDDENICPVIFEINDLDMDLLEVESFGTLQDFLQKTDGMFYDDIILHYKGEVNLEPSNAIYL